MSEKFTEFKLPSTLESIDAAVAKTTELASDLNFSDEAIFGIDMAVRESVTNAIKHGNNFDETKNVEISIEETEEKFIVTVRDFGEGFAVEEVPDPTDPENLLKATGRGILFMNNFMDEIEWRNHPTGGTIVKMTKKR